MAALRRAIAAAAAAAAGAGAGRSPAWLGFEPTPWEQRFDSVPLQPTGAVPAWINGTFFSNGPGRWQSDAWFVPLAYIVALRFDGGAVTYSSRFMETTGYYTECFVAGVCKKVPRKLTGETCPITFTQIDGSYLATTVASTMSSFDPRTLALVESPFKFGPDSLDNMPHAAMPHDVMLSDGVRLHHYVDSRAKSAVVYEVPAGSRARSVIATVPDDGDGHRYQHQSLGTADWYVMFEGPCFGQMASWDPAKGTRVRLLNRHTGASQVYHTTTNFFTTHQINAFVDGGDVVADIVSSECGCVLSTKSFKLSLLRGDAAPMNYSYMTNTFRLRLPIGRPNATVTPAPLAAAGAVDRGVEFPTVAPSVLGLPYTYVYMSQLASAESAWYDMLVKMNVRTGALQSFSRPGWYLSEPEFIPAPNPASEDDGAAVAIALDIATNSSLLLVLDAKTWALTASAPCPETLPFRFHGKFYGPTPIS